MAHIPSLSTHTHIVYFSKYGNADLYLFLVTIGLAGEHFKRCDTLIVTKSLDTKAFRNTNGIAFDRCRFNVDNRCWLILIVQIIRVGATRHTNKQTNKHIQSLVRKSMIKSILMGVYLRYGDLDTTISLEYEFHHVLRKQCNFIHLFAHFLFFNVSMHCPPHRLFYGYMAIVCKHHEIDPLSSTECKEKTHVNIFLKR